ncbi:uncharacterized protein LOC117318055 [Pecten maximus]|uniref:uncharacterized protein LOC117318055 n=1 Tax=Pecten maximus TaxID=6579 RepID=UPI00145803C1|nr:uncharacterized protein LOC117318055 [Pecten maximus]
MRGYIFPWITILCHVGVLRTSAIRFEGKFEWESEEHVTLKISDEARHKRSSDGLTSYPDVFGVTFDTANTSIDLTLRRNYGVDENVPVYVIRGERVVMETLPPPNRTAFYQDSVHSAAFIVQYTDKGMTNMHGTVVVKGVQYFLEKSPGTSQVSDVAEFRLRKFKSKSVEFADPIPEGKGDDIDRNKKEDFSSDNVKLDDAIHHDVTFNDVTHDGATLDDVADAIPDLISKHHLVKRSVTNHELEFLVVTDYSVYKYWYDVSTASTSSAKAIEAKESIRQYYAYVINEIDMKYSNLQSSIISIDVVLADIVIADTVASSPWTEDTVVDGKVDAATVLVNFTTWHQTATNLPGHDHAMLFSKYDFTAVIGGTVSSGVAGT